MDAMNDERFAALAEAWGADLRRWPEAERAAAQAWSEASPDAAALQEDAGRTDELLWASPSPSPSAALVQRVISAGPAPRAERRRLWTWLTGAGVGASLAAACAAGVAVGGLIAPAYASIAAPRETHAGIPDEAVADLAETWDAG